MRHPIRRYMIIMLLLTLLPGLWILVSPKGKSLADSTSAPGIIASPGTPTTGGAAPLGATVTVAGQGFSAGETIALALNKKNLITNPSQLLAGTNGSFSGTFKVPFLTVRAYPLVAVGQSSGTSASLIFWLKAPNESVYSPTSGQDSYQITNTSPREPQMDYLRITNTGDANLVNPKVLPDSLPGQDPVVDMSSLQSIVNGILAANPNAVTDAQKAFAIWQWLTDYDYHYYDAAQSPNATNQLDAVGMLNNYGFTRCWNHARLLADLFQTAGYQTRTWNLNGHAVPEVYYANAWHMYDADEEKYFVGADGSTVLGVQDLINNPQPIFLDSNVAGVALHNPASQMANFYYTTGDNTFLGNIYPPAPHDFGLTLRKNETLMEYWSDIGKVHNDSSYSTPPVRTDGDIVYTPDLSQSSYQNGVLSQTNVSNFSQDGLQPDIHSQTSGATTSLVYQVKSPYVLVGSLLNAQTYLATSSDSLNIYFSLDGTNWGNPVYTQTKLGYDSPTLDFSSLLNNGVLPEEYQYYVMFQWTANSAPNGAGLNGFNLDSQFQQAWEAIPPLHSGTTQIAYSDQSNLGAYTPGTVQIAYGWKTQPAAPNLGGSSLTADYTTIPANGATFANVTLNLKTSTSMKLPYTVVQLVPNVGANVQIERVYQNQSLRGQTDTNGQALFEVRSQQAGTVTLTAADKNGVSLGLPPVTLNFTTPPPPTTMTSTEGSTMTNGGFETGDLSGWTAGGTVAPVVESSTVFNGTYAAQLGAASTTGTATDSSLLETLTPPTTTKKLNLSYWLANPNADSGNYLEIWVQDTAGDRVYRLFVANTDSGGWNTVSLPYFNKFRGNTIQVYFNLHQDGSSNAAYAYLDNVQIS